MVEVRKTDVFARWIDGLTDPQARARILARIERLAMGKEIIILLAGGDKRTQAKDIKLAIRLAKNL